MLREVVERPILSNFVRKTNFKGISHNFKVNWGTSNKTSLNATIKQVDGLYNSSNRKILKLQHQLSRLCIGQAHK